MMWIKWALIVVVGLYLVALLAVYVLQRNFMYFPDTRPAPVGFEARHGVEIITVHVEGIGELKSVYAPPSQQDGPVILFFHGNGNSVYSRVSQFRDFKSWGAGFLAVEYPGYGGNPGRPNQADIFTTALAYYDWLIAQGHRPDQIVIYGHSLGSASAVHVAQNRDSTLLILSAPFLSTLAMAQKQMPFFPTRVLLKDQYRSDLAMPTITEPLLVIHGNADDVIPYKMGQQLYALHLGDKAFVTIKGGQHYLWNTDMPEHIHAAVVKYTSLVGDP